MDPGDLIGAAVFGIVLATMNVVFYIAIEYLPLGTAVAIEFLGPVAVAGITGRGWRDRVGHRPGRGRRRAAGRRAARGRASPGTR